MDCGKEAANLALFCGSLASENDTGKAFHLGAVKASRDVCRSLLKYADPTNERVYLVRSGAADVCDPGNQVLWGRNIGGNTRIYRLQELRNLPANSLRWFEPNGITPSYSAARRRQFNGVFPITYAHHTISYHYQMLTTFVPLLYSGMLPCDSIICPSVASKRAISNILLYLKEGLRSSVADYRGRLDVIPYGADTSLFKPLDKAQCRRIFGIPRDRTVFLYFGRISIADKADLSPILTCFRRLRQRIRQSHIMLVVAGGARDEHLSDLKKKARELGIEADVRFITRVRDDERVYLYNIADVFISPVDNIQESFGLSITEAMSCGIPQLVSDWSGYRETVVHGSTGYLVPTYWGPCDAEIINNSVANGSWISDHFLLGQSVCIDIEYLISRMVDLISNPDLRYSMSQNSRARALSVYDWRAIVSRYTSLWTELSAIAGSLNPDQLDREGISTPAYYKLFGHFSSANVDDGWLIYPALEARDKGQRRWPRASYLGRDPTAVLGLIESLFQTNEETRVADLLSLYPPPDIPEALRSLLFLAKHGYIRLCPNQEIGCQEQRIEKRMFQTHMPLPAPALETS